MRRALPLALVLAASAITCGGGRSYVEENERLLESLPEIRDSQRLSVQSNRYNECDPGYTTNVNYKVPDGMTPDDVTGFYVENLKDEWEYELEEINIAQPQPTPIILGKVALAHFSRGGASVSVNSTAMAVEQSSLESEGQQPPSFDFELVVDSDGVRDRVYCD